MHFLDYIGREYLYPVILSYISVDHCIKSDYVTTPSIKQPIYIVDAFDDRRGEKIYVSAAVTSEAVTSEADSIERWRSR